MALRTNRRTWAVKKEAVSGTPEVLAGTDCVMVSEAKIEQVVSLFEQKVVSPSFSAWPSIPGATYGKGTAKALFRCSGAAGTAPAIGKLLEACGLAPTVNAGVSVVYAPITDGIDPITIGGYEDGLKKVISGALGNGKFSGKFGEPGEWSFDFDGLYNAVADAAMLVPSGLETARPPVLLSGGFALHGSTLPIHGFELDLGTKYALVPDGNAANGYKSAVVTERTVKGKVTVEAVLVASFDVWGKCKSGAEGALTITFGGTAGNKYTIAGPAIQVMKVNPGSANGIETWDIDIEFKRSSFDAGDDEFSITVE